MPSISRVLTADGRQRRVGVEVEFMGPSAHVAARALARVFGGSLQAEDPHAYRIDTDALGSMRIEVDLRHVHPKRHPNLTLTLHPWVAAWLGTLVLPIVPRELIMDPVPITRLPEVDRVVSVLREARASGRGAILWESLGLHFNIDPPSLDAGTVTAFLKAFLLLEDELRFAVSGGGRWPSRLFPPRYPTAYRQTVLDPEYWPDIHELARDYLVANPTRKRALDLLPLLSHLDGEQVRSALPREKIGPRPVFHYRLPLAHPGDPTWSIMPDWHRWLEIERLAADPLRLSDMGRVVTNGGQSERPKVSNWHKADLSHNSAVMG
jgi:hypothetical protein